MATKAGTKPEFSLTTVFVPQKKQNLASFMAVGADATDPSTYGKFTILRLPDTTQVPGPSQIANQFSNDPKVAEAVRPFKQADARIEYGNLLTLPVGGGLLYVQPLYTTRQSGAGTYPVLRYVLTSFGRDVGIGDTLDASLADVLKAGLSDNSTSPGTPTTNPGAGTNQNQNLPVGAMRLLQQADRKFAEADKALKNGDLQGYAKAVNEAKVLVEQALTSKK